MTLSHKHRSEITNPHYLRLFFYGTLKRGFQNHDRFCLGFLALEDAMVRGRLFEMPEGYPLLQVPEEDILAVGTTDPLADVATQAKFTALLSNPKTTPQRFQTNGEGLAFGPVYGELLTFDDPAIRLPAIDRLEDFRPGTPSVYRRVLLSVWTKEAVMPAWTYVAQKPILSGVRHLSGSCWPSKNPRA